MEGPPPGPRAKSPPQSTPPPPGPHCHCNLKLISLMVEHLPELLGCEFAPLAGLGSDLGCLQAQSRNSINIC